MNGHRSGVETRNVIPMDTDQFQFKHGELTRKIIGIFYEVYNELGHGFLESVYANALALALRQAGIEAVQQAPITVSFRGQIVGDFRADLLVEHAVIIELKAVKALDSTQEAQLLNYLRATEIEVGPLINFGPKPEFKRFAFDNRRKKGEPRISANERG